MVKVIGKAEQEVPKVMILGGDNSPKALADLKAVKDLEFVPAEPDYRQQISEKKIRAAVDLPSGFDESLKDGKDATVKIYDYSGDLKSGIAVG